MGNRGCLHDALGNVTKQSARIAWVTCLLDFKGRKREVMSPGQYTELFFLDEVTALAAGHRPCGTCQKARYENFKELWGRANSTSGTTIQEIDRSLLGERWASSEPAARWQSSLAELPDGAFVAKNSNLDAALLYWTGLLYPWTPGGYAKPVPSRPDERVTVITPRSICRLLTVGFTPRVHASLHVPSGPEAG